MTEEYIVRILSNDDCITEGELIRCKGCSHWNYEDSGIDGASEGECCWMHICTDGMFYCAGAERREDER